MPKRKERPARNWQPVLASDTERECLATVSDHFDCQHRSHAVVQAVRVYERLMDEVQAGAQLLLCDDAGGDAGVVDWPARPMEADELEGVTAQSDGDRWTVLVTEASCGRAARIAKYIDPEGGTASWRDVYRVAICRVGMLLQSLRGGLHLWVSIDDEFYRVGVL